MNSGFEIMIVSIVVAVMAFVVGIVFGAQMASNSVKAWSDDSYIYVQVLGETQVHCNN